MATSIENVARLTTHAETKFEPYDYINRYYEHFDETDEKYDCVRFILDSLWDIYASGKITGDRLLDIGTGPVTYTVYPARKWFREIVLSDLSKSNLSVLRDWKAGNVRYLKSVYEYLIQLEGRKDDWITCNQRLADQVTSIVHCDLRKDDPVSGSEVEGIRFDAISLCQSQICASLTTKEYEASVRNYSRLLKTRGFIIVIDLLGQSFYKMGSITYQTYQAEKTELLSLYSRCGYEVTYWKQHNGPFHETYVQQKDVSFFAMVARKVFEA